MKRIVKITEDDITRIVKSVISEQNFPNCQNNTAGKLLYDTSYRIWKMEMSSGGFCKVPVGPVTPPNYYDGHMCFVSETLVNMSDGTKKSIGTIEVGDKVLSLKNKNSVVSEIEVHSTNNLSIITLSNGDEIKTTDTHAFYVKDKGLSVISPDRYEEGYGDKLEQLVEGDLLIDVEQNNLSIESIEFVTLENEIEVFNLRVDGEENYYVNNVLVSD